MSPAMWPVVIRMKVMSRVLLFMGSLVAWAIILTLINDQYFNVDEYVLLLGATTMGILQTWILALVLHT